MFDDLGALFFEQVHSSVVRYLAVSIDRTYGNSADTKAAIEACSALYHFREHLPPNLSPTNGSVIDVCPDYRLIGDVTNAAKHGRLTRCSPVITSPTQIEETIVVTEYCDAFGSYRHATKELMVRLNDGSARNLRSAIIGVAEWWAGSLHEWGVIHVRPSYTLPPAREPRARAECDPEMHLAMISGVRAKPSFRLEKYDYEQHKLVAVDLTGSDLRFELYQSSVAVDLVLTNDITGEKVVRSVELTDQQQLELGNMMSQVEIESFLGNLPAARRAVVEARTEIGLRSTAGFEVPSSEEDETTEAK